MMPQASRISLYAVVLRLTFTGTHGHSPNQFQYDNATVYIVRSMNTWFVKAGLDKLDWPGETPDLNLTEHLWDEFECKLHSRPSCPGISADLSNALVVEWAQSPTTTFQDLVESLLKRVAVIITAKGVQFGMGCSTCTCDDQCPHTFGYIVCVCIFGTLLDVDSIYYSGFLFVKTNLIFSQLICIVL